MGVFKSEISVRPEEHNTIFQINDILLEVPPTHISVRKEDMAWQWKTLRTKTSTKIPSGRGIVQVSVRLVFVPEHFLTMHRLITEFKHSPFCYIENALIRDSIVPDWMNTQAMAFTMTGLNVQNMTGSPGTFIVDLDLRWFNYAPYAINWLYRDEYATKPVGPEGITRTIATFDPGLKKKETIIDFLPKGTEVLDSYEILSQTKDIVGGFTMDDLLYNHAGTAFDLLPRPTDVMRKAMPVPPHLSNIYKRYINILQQKSLFNNFDVDIAQMIKDQEIGGQIKELYKNDSGFSEVDEQEVRANFQGSTWKMFTSGEVITNSQSTYNRVEALHSDALPRSVRDEVIKKCLSYCKEIDFYWHQYIVTNEDPKIRKALSKKNQKDQEAIALEYIKNAKLLDNIAEQISNRKSSSVSSYTGPINTKSIADVDLISVNNIPTSERITYSTEKSKLLSLIPTKEESDRLDKSWEEPPYLFSPLVKEVIGLSGFGMRQLDESSGIKPHNGIDIVSSSDNSLYAPFNGTLKVTSASPYNTYKENLFGINQFTGNNDSVTEPGLGNNSRISHLKRKGLSRGNGISIVIASKDYPGYSVEIHHMEMIGENGRIGNVQVANFFTDKNDVQNYGGIEILSEVEVTRGQLIGRYGNTGHSTGAHLHLGLKKDGVFYDPLPFLIARDVSNLSDEDLEKLNLTIDGLPEANPTSPIENKYGESAQVPLYGETTIVDLDSISDQNNSTIDLDPEVIKEYESRELNYIAEGFLPYEDLQDVKNVRKRTVRYRFASQNNDLLPGIVPEFLNKDTAYLPQEEDPNDNTHVFTLKSTDNMVITNVVGSLSHVVASIPLLGHEFPTHQHLGSIEPSYTVEMVTQADSLYRDNLSAEGALLEIMRSTLQKNARQFRPIPDGYALVTDHFITRLLGSFEKNDVAFLGSGENETGIDSIKKRTMINRVSTQTVEGHPGLSSIQMTFVETNPYETEQLVIQEETTQNEREELIKEVLHRLYNMNLTSAGRLQKLVEDYSTDIYTEEDDIATKLAAAGLSPNDFGKTSWDEITEVAVVRANNGTLSSGLNESSLIEEEEAWRVLEEIRQTAEEGDFQLYGQYHKPIQNSESAVESIPLSGRQGTETLFYFNMSDFYTVYPELKPNNGSSIHANQLDLTAKHNFLKEVIRSASISLAEPELGSTQEAVAEAFYNLPVQQEMMSCFYYFFEKYLIELSGADNYTDDSTDLSNSVNIMGESVQDFLNAISWNFNYKEPSKENKDLIDASIEEIVSKGFDLSVAIGELLEFAGSYDDTSISAEQAEMIEDFKSSVRELAQKYVEAFMKISIDKESLGILESAWADIVEMIEGVTSYFSTEAKEVKQSTAYDTAAAQIDYLLNWLLSPDLLGQIDNQPLLHLYKAMKSISSGANMAIFLLTIIGGALTVAAAIVPADGPVGEATAATGTVAGVSAIRAFAVRLASFIASKQGLKSAAAIARSKEAALGSTFLGGAISASTYTMSQLNDGTYSESNENTAAYQFIINGLASPDYPSFINSDTEAQKLVFFRKKLIQIAESIISNPGLITALGIRTENFILPSMINEWVGKECYPDLDLPEHPYYVGTNSYAMSPDFYMWNVYEDGSAAIKDEIKRVVEQGVSTVVDNSYNFMKQMQKKGINAVRDGGFQVNNGMTNNLPKIVSLHMNPEGSDEQTTLSAEAKFLPRTNAIAPLTLDANGKEIWKTYETSISAFGANPLVENKAWDMLKSSSVAESGKVIDLNTDAASRTPGRIYANNNNPAKILEGSIPVVSLSNYDGNINYFDSQTRVEVYNQYFEKVQNIKDMFGSRQSYLGDEVTEQNANEIVSSIGDTALASLSENTNWYTRGGIESLVKQSSADIVSQKITMRRAYPTFKLYFVEEDEQESRWLNLDDFYSFNAVKEFNFYQSRKEASSTATIVLQNIAGTLDGTRRNAIVDLDYFSRENAGEIEKKNNVEVLADNKQHVESKDQPFTALVLRPGMNVQLRVGYSNDPNMLHVLLNGRVVDVQWNMTGDLTEITVQSFGTELNQTIKGIGGNDYNVDWNDKIFYTTHDLLGSLMLDRDLKHFGRWEFGRLTQIGEDKNADLDFYPYEDEGFLGGSPATKWVYELFTEHPYAVGLTILGAAALLSGRFKMGSKVFAKGRAGRILERIPLLRRAPGVRRLFYSVDDVTAAARTVSTHSEANQIWTALSKEAKEIDDALAALNLAPEALSATQKLRAAMTGIDGGVRLKQINRLKQFTSTLIPNTGKEASVNVLGRRNIALIREIEAIAQWNSVSRFVNWPRFGLAQLKSWSGIKSNFWALPNVTLGNMAIKPFTNTFTVGVGALAVAGISDSTGLSEYTIQSMKEFIRGIEKRTARVNARLKLTPADDNLFPPSPAAYMTLRKIKDISTFNKWSIITNQLFANTIGFDVREAWKTVNAVINPEDIDPSVFEKRVLPPACQYKIHASTIWQVFEEMTYRHPGWIWGTRPYGTEFRDTMFFGTPSQRYWSRPAGNSFVVRMNKLYEYIQRTGETEDVLKKQITEVYGSAIAEKMIEESSRIDMEGAYESMTGTRNTQLSPYPDYSPLPNLVDILILKDKFRVAIMDEWLKGMEQRFEPFRRYHLITSENDIVSNNIICSEHSVVNAAQVTYKEMDELGQINEEETKVLQMKANSLIPDHMLNTTVVDAHNCISRKMALRYGQAAMIYGLKEMYKGEISLLGNPRIRPWDVCILADSYNDMSGPIEVESVVHMFSHETGFLTEIKPNALVIGNEIATFPMLEALKLYAMAKKDLENNTINVDGGTVNRTAESTQTTQAAQDYFKKRYEEIYDEGASEYLEELNKVIEESRLLGNLGIKRIDGSSLSPYPTAGEAVGGGDVGLALEVMSQNTETSWVVGKGIAAAAATVTLGVAAGVSVAKIPQLLGITSRGASIATGLLGGTAVGGSVGYSLFPDKESIIDSAATFIGSKLLFAKCMELETVMVIPLLKGQRPVVSGMTLKNPSDVFESILGSVTNVIEDTIVGTRNMHESWRDYRSASWMQVDDIVNERNTFFRKWYTENQIFYNWQEDYRVGSE